MLKSNIGTYHFNFGFFIAQFQSIFTGISHNFFDFLKSCKIRKICWLENFVCFDFVHCYQIKKTAVHFSLKFYSIRHFWLNFDCFQALYLNNFDLLSNKWQVRCIKKLNRYLRWLLDLASLNFFFCSFYNNVPHRRIIFWVKFVLIFKPEK